MFAVGRRIALASLLVGSSSANLFRFFGSANAQPTPFGIPIGHVAFMGGPPLQVFNWPGFQMGGQARHGLGGEPIIIINGEIPRPFFDFVLAHEYGHHALGHITQLVLSRMRGGPMEACYLTPNIELQADSWATVVMRQLGNSAAVQAAMEVNAWQGLFAVDCYPPGIMRAENIRRTWFS